MHSGSPDLPEVLTRHSEMGIGASLQENSCNVESRDACTLHTDTPDEASVDIRNTSTFVSATNEELASVIFNVVNSALDAICK